MGLEIVEIANIIILSNYLCFPTDTVVFDNSYSFLRGKKLAYNVRITLPVKEKTISTIDQMVNMEE